ncbi:MAG: hypothetical protein H0T62_10145 [Parachlamydiaceae bacterium]|jgi:hypothetical protein|nr:hypothetical protein [Parachlamydiaceae bacterium]
MADLAENYIVRFINIAKKKDGMFANYKVKGIKGGTTFSTSICVDLNAADMDPSHTLEQIIEQCAQMAVREFKKSELQFEGMIAN